MFVTIGVMFKVPIIKKKLPQRVIENSSTQKARYDISANLATRKWKIINISYKNTSLVISMMCQIEIYEACLELTSTINAYYSTLRLRRFRLIIVTQSLTIIVIR